MNTTVREHSFRQRIILVICGVFALFGLALVVASSVQVKAAQIGPAGQITLNPGGGVVTDGSDGIRFTINSTTASGNPNYAYSGGDAVVYRNTYQYCCGAGAPMLNIGGTLYGQAGPATSSTGWNSIEVISTSGATSIGTRTATIGNSSAVVRYTAIRSGLTYTMTRTVSYVYPNDYVTDSYSFVIPDTNAATVKFYLGGDTAPGSSDSGYGIMLTSPVRSVISLNTSSQIMFGLREVEGSKIFDGATSRQYSAPYSTVQTGGDIGYVVTSSNHDAGLMMQWNLGSTPGTQTATLQQFATRQGTNLNASLSTNSTDIDAPVTLGISLANTVLSTVSGLGYTLTLPSGVVIGSGSQSNTCGGTLTATAGSNTVTLSGGSVASGSNCATLIPIVSSTAGTYAISSSSFSSLVGSLTNNVGASSLTVLNPALGADINGDSVDDTLQPNLFSYTSAVTSKTVALLVDPACTVMGAESQAVTGVAVPDEGFEYVNGLMDFSLSCGTPGFTATIIQYYYDVSKEGMVLRKYNPNTEVYTTIDNVTLEERTINDRTVTVVTYEVEDGGELDTDGLVDGNITDPAGLASLAGSGSSGSGAGSGSNPGVPNTGVKAFEIPGGLVAILVGLFIVSLARAIYPYSQRI